MSAHALRHERPSGQFSKSPGLHASVSFFLPSPTPPHSFTHVIFRKGLRGCLHEKTHTSTSFILGWLFDFLLRLHDDRVISYHIIWRYTSCWYNTCVFKNRKHYVCTTHSSLPADQFQHWNGWSIHVYMIPLQDFVLEWNSCPGTTTKVNSRWGDSCRHHILWWYHVNKYRVMRGNQRWTRTVNSPLDSRSSFSALKPHENAN